ncbi:MAG: hypothetical protein LBJ95_02340 [Oscillospiraceae bacterium]|nr:hypothetical protein [Oscillospiraceae bacterium]
MKFKLKWLNFKQTLYLLSSFLFLPLIKFWILWGWFSNGLLAENIWIAILNGIIVILNIAIAVLLAVRAVYLCVNHSLY